MEKGKSTMIEGVQVVSVPVSDQDRSRAFSIDTLGFELRTENSFGGDMRWIEVAPKDSSTSLSLVTWFDRRVGVYIFVTEDATRQVELEGIKRKEE